MGFFEVGRCKIYSWAGCIARGWLTVHAFNSSVLDPFFYLYLRP
jgi:hypothetical protein